MVDKKAAAQQIESVTDNVKEKELKVSNTAGDDLSSLIAPSRLEMSMSDLKLVSEKLVSHPNVPFDQIFHSTRHLKLTDPLAFIVKPSRIAFDLNNGF